MKPMQKPHPPIWIGAVADRAIRRAARLADAWYPAPYGPLGDIERGLSYYRECLEEFGRPAPAELPIRRDMYVGADQDAAMRDGSRYLGGETSLWRGMDYDPDRFWIGSPEAIVEQIERYREKLGDLFWVFRIHWPGMPYETVVEQIELFPPLSAELDPFEPAAILFDRHVIPEELSVDSKIVSPFGFGVVWIVERDVLLVGDLNVLHRFLVERIQDIYSISSQETMKQLTEHVLGTV